MNTRVKICGIRTAAALDAALEAGADDIGLVFFQRSPRHVGLDEAAALADAARGRARIVALTVDADDAALEAIAVRVRPELWQLHGSETPARCRFVKARWKVPVMKSVGVSSTADAARARDYVGAADLILFDAKPPADATLPGGNGLAFDWALIADIGMTEPFVLSGGLTPDTVAEAIRVTAAHTVDVSSGVERAPGVKDAELIRRFVAAAKSAHPSTG